MGRHVGQPLMTARRVGFLRIMVTSAEYLRRQVQNHHLRIYGCKSKVPFFTKSLFLRFYNGKSRTTFAGSSRTNPYTLSPPGASKRWCMDLDIKQHNEEEQSCLNANRLRLERLRKSHLLYPTCRKLLQINALVIHFVCLTEEPVKPSSLVHPMLSHFLLSIYILARLVTSGATVL